MPASSRSSSRRRCAASRSCSRMRSRWPCSPRWWWRAARRGCSQAGGGRRPSPRCCEAAMTPDQIFTAANLLALAGWVLLALLPGRRWVSTAIVAVVIPALLAVVYIGILATQWGGADGGFGSLAQVSQLFANQWLLLAGWVH